MAITKEAEEITERLYRVYGSHSGWLFGISPDKKDSVEAVVQSVMNFIAEAEALAKEG